MRRIDYFAPSGADRNRRAADPEATARRIHRLFAVPNRDRLMRVEAIRAYERAQEHGRPRVLDWLA
jgi:hypothetical protein